MALIFPEIPADNLSMRHMRRDARNLCADLVKIRWKDSTGAMIRETATLEDISAAGACLQVEKPIPPDTILTILYPKGRYEGRVRYCLNQESRHFVGVEFHAGYRWSARQYNPAHLLRVQLGGDSDE